MDALEKLAGELGGNVHPLACNLADKDQVEALLPAAEKALGQVDILVNNAGITRDGTMHKMDCDQWNAVITTNLGSCFNMCRVVIDGMRSRGFGRIVNVGRLGGTHGDFNFDLHAARRISYIGVTFRTRSIEEIREIFDILADPKETSDVSGRVTWPDAHAE